MVCIECSVSGVPGVCGGCSVVCGVVVSMVCVWCSMYGMCVMYGVY